MIARDSGQRRATPGRIGARAPTAVAGPAGERLMLRLHPHWVVFARSTAPPATVTAAAVSAVAAIAGPEAAAGALVLVGLPLVGLWSLVTWVRRASVSFTLTDRRVSLEAGILRRQTTDIALEQVTHVDVRQSLVGWALGYGTLEVGAPHPAALLVFADAPGPGRLSDLITTAQRWQDVFAYGEQAARGARVRDEPDVVRRVEGHRHRG